MPGIVSYSAYLPYYRLKKEEIGRAWGKKGSLKGEKTVASFDEDSLSMAVTASLDSLSGLPREQVGGIFLASCTLPYKEKQASAIAAAALDLPPTARTADFTGSPRTGTQALGSALDAVVSGAVKEILVAAADTRLGAPGSDLEMLLGDGAAALLIGNSDTVAEIEGSFHLASEFFDCWRPEEEMFIRSWEERFAISEGYLKTMSSLISGILNKYNYQPQDFTKIILYSPDQRSSLAVAQRTGFDAGTQLQSSFFDLIGNTGSPAVLIALAAALDEARPGDRFLLAGYGDGAEAFIFRVTEQINDFPHRRRLNNYLKNKRYLDSYEKYLAFRKIIPVEPPRLPDPYPPSVPVLWRNREGVLILHGAKCRKCATIHYPPQRICVTCNSKDDFESVRFYDQRGQIFTYAADYVLTPNPDPPTVYCWVDFEGGSRVQSVMTDIDMEKLTVGLKVEMTFRKIFEAKGIKRYGWKLRPLRGKEVEK